MVSVRVTIYMTFVDWGETRHRRPRFDHRGAEGVGHLPSYHATSILTRRTPIIGTFGRATLRTTRLRQDNARKGSCA